MADVKARRIARGLIANAEAIHTDAVDWQTFRARNRALWAQAKTPEIQSQVLALLRKHEEERMAKKKSAKKTTTAKGNGKPVEAKKETKKAPKKEKAPKEDLVVFAFRLTAEERDAIHAAAGPAKASKYVRALALAATKGDEKSVVEIVRAVKTAS